MLLYDFNVHNILTIISMSCFVLKCAYFVLYKSIESKYYIRIALVDHEVQNNEEKNRCQKFATLRL